MASHSAEDPRNGRIITFYSYKGGTGRTMAAVNVAYLFAGGLGQSGPRRVLVIDWDLEAPGVPKYVPGIDRHHLGLIDYFIELRKQLEAPTEGAQRYATIAETDRLTSQGEMLCNVGRGAALNAVLAIEPYLQADVGDPKARGRLTVLSAGRDDEAYAARVTRFDWPGFFEKFPLVFAALRELLESQFDCVLIDSRTGVTDSSGICSVLLPECLVCVFTPNRQSLEGGCEMVKRALKHRRSGSLDPRPLLVYPLPSRVENAEFQLREQWRIDYQRQFEKLFQEVYGEPECDLTSYFDDIKVHHRSNYAYGENVAVLIERNEEHSLTRVFRAFASWLDSAEPSWGEHPSAALSETRPQPDRDPQEPSQRVTAAPTRKWLQDGRLLSGADLTQATEWAAQADFLYPKEVELLSRSMQQELHRRTRRWLTVLAVTGTLSSLSFYGIYWRQVRDQQTQELAHLSEAAAASDRRSKDLEASLQAAQGEAASRRKAVETQQQLLDQAKAAAKDAQAALVALNEAKEKSKKDYDQLRLKAQERLQNAEAAQTKATVAVQVATEQANNARLTAQQYQQQLDAVRGELSAATEREQRARSDAESSSLAAQQALQAERDARKNAEATSELLRRDLAACKDKSILQAADLSLK